MSNDYPQPMYNQSMQGQYNIPYQPEVNQNQDVYTIEGTRHNDTNIPSNFTQQSYEPQSNSSQSERSYNPFSSKNVDKVSSYMKNAQSYTNQAMPYLSKLGSNMLGSQANMDSFIGTAKEQFPDILRRSMNNTENLIRKDILKSINKVIESNQTEIKEVIINKVNEIIDNAKNEINNEEPISVEGSIVENENNKE
jgi:hypothetical protein